MLRTIVYFSEALLSFIHLPNNVFEMDTFEKKCYLPVSGWQHHITLAGLIVNKEGDKRQRRVPKHVTPASLYGVNH